MFLTGADSFQKFARGVLYVFVAVFPFLLYRGFLFNGTSTRAINLVIMVEVLAICLGLVLFRNTTKISFWKSPITLALVILFFSLIISSLTGVDLSTSFWSKITRMSGLFYFLHLGFLYFLFSILFSEERSFRTFLKVFLISSGVFSIAALLGKDGFGLIFVNREWMGFTFGNSTFAAMYLFAAFILSIYYVFSMEKGIRKFWHYLVPLAFIANPYFINADFWRGNVNIFRDPSAILGGAQASSYAMIVSLVLLLSFWSISKIRSLKIRKTVIWSVVIFGAIISTLAVRSLLTPSGFLQDTYLKQASGSRPIVWSLSEKAIAERPAFGWGVDNFDRAFEAHYDNRIMEQEKGGEAWFDRAHNIFIDQAVETGYIGVAVYVLAFLVIIASMLYVIFRSKDQGDQALAVFVIIYFLGHLMELQTAFDTTISYLPLVFIAGTAAMVFHRAYRARVGGSSELVFSRSVRYGFAGTSIVLFVSLFFIGSVSIARTQIANGDIRTAGSSEKRLPVYETVFSSPVDKAGFLNRTVTDFQRGISINPSVLKDPNAVEGFIKELEIFIVRYQEYLLSHPDEYRSRIKLADLYIYQRLFDVNNLDKAHQSADIAIGLVPQAPQAYWQKSVAYLYQRKFTEAREWAKKAYDLNPNIEESQRLMKYIEDSIKTFPNIRLYNFVLI